jgi:hypothetical protein
LDTQRMLREVEEEIAKLQRVADALRSSASEKGASSGTRRVLSAAARKKISLAQKARWAKRAGTIQVTTMKPQRTMSAAGRKRIAAAQRARWAKVKAAQKKAA